MIFSLKTHVINNVIKHIFFTNGYLYFKTGYLFNIIKIFSECNRIILYLITGTIIIPTYLLQVHKLYLNNLDRVKIKILIFSTREKTHKASFRIYKF